MPSEGQNLPESQDALLLQRRARRRLVGAIALVLFVVIALPIVFDQEPRQVPQDLVIDIPNPESGKFQPRLDAPAAQNAKPAEASPPAIASPETAKQGDASAKAVTVAGKPAADSGKGKPEVDAKPNPAEPPKVLAEAAKEASKAERAPDESAASNEEKPKAKNVDYVVSLGVFSDPANAKQAQAKAQAAGLKLYTERLKAPHGVQMRVRAGPFVTRDAAEHARDKLKSLGLSPGGVVAREQPSREQP